jgi:CubicO group peptidase (beta-lactamase class C family)
MSVSELIARAEREIDDGLLPSCQLALARHGELEVFEALGDARPDDRYVIYSVSKALTAGVAWLAFGEHKLEPTGRVAELVPEFAGGGKDAVTIEQLLLHTSGFPHAPMLPLEGADRAKRRERFASWRLDWEPGTQTEYHTTSAHWVLGETIDNVGDEYRTLFNERIARPLGLERLRLGGPEAVDGVLDVRIAGGDGEMSAGEIDLPNIKRHTILYYNDPAVRAAGVPGAGAVGNAAEVAVYFQALIHNPGELWDPDVLADGTGTIRNAMTDPYTRSPANRSRGLVLAGDDGKAFVRGFGKTAGPRAFASPGVGGQVAWADPDSGVSFCYLTNGIDTDLVRAFRRSLSLSTLAEAWAAG